MGELSDKLRKYARVEAEAKLRAKELKDVQKPFKDSMAASRKEMLASSVVLQKILNEAKLYQEQVLSDLQTDIFHAWKAAGFPEGRTGYGVGAYIQVTPQPYTYIPTQLEAFVQWLGNIGIPLSNIATVEFDQEAIARLRTLYRGCAGFPSLTSEKHKPKIVISTGKLAEDEK